MNSQFLVYELTSICIFVKFHIELHCIFCDSLLKCLRKQSTDYGYAENATFGCIFFPSFGTLMTATLEWEGTPAFIIGIARGVSATIGIAATFVYPKLQSRISTIRVGLWSIWSQVCITIISYCHHRIIRLFINHLYVYVYAVELTTTMHCFHLGSQQNHICIHVDGRSGGVSTRVMDV